MRRFDPTCDPRHAGDRRVYLRAALCFGLTLGLAGAPAIAAAEEVPTSIIKVVRKPTPAPAQKAKPKARAASRRSQVSKAQALVRQPTPGPGAARMLPSPAAPAEQAPPLTAQTTPPSETKVLPWVTLVGSLASGVAGAIFIQRSISALNEDVAITVKSSSSNTDSVTLPPEVEAQQRRVLTNGMVGTALLTTGVVGTIASIIALN